MSVVVEPASSAGAKALADDVRSIRSAWNDKDYARTLSQSRTLLEREPDNIPGLIYLARAAAYTRDWATVAAAGAALVRHSPRDAFVAARKLNQAGQARRAAGIFAVLDVRQAWFDAEITDMAWAEAVSLLRAGQVAEDSGDVGLAKVLWVAGARIAPHSQTLATRLRRLAAQAKTTAGELDSEADLRAYVDAWREVLWLDPSSLQAATKLAWAYERLNAADAIDAWLKVLAFDPDQAKACERLRRLALRNGLQDRVIAGLLELELGGQQGVDALIRELEEGRESQARAAKEGALKSTLREALARANAIDRAADPVGYLAAWKQVLAVDSLHLGAAKKIVSAAQALGDHSEHVEGLIALLDITPGEALLQQRLVSAARRAGKEQRALEYLARHGLGSVPAEKLEGLRKRVLNGCKRAVSVADYDLALSNFRTLALVSNADDSLQPLQLSLVRKAASSAREAEKQGDLAVAVPLARQVLEIVPDHPVALRIVARDLLRQKRFGEVVALCSARIKPGAEYEAVQKLVERAAAKLESQSPGAEP